MPNICTTPFDDGSTPSGSQVLGAGPPLGFERVSVSYLVAGCGTVYWEISPHLHDNTPWSFQLQVSESDTPNANWTNVGSPVINTYSLQDTTQRWFGKSQNAFYRVVLTTANNTYNSNPVDVKGKLDWHNWQIGREIIRKEMLRLRQLRVGTEGWLLKAKRSGTTCPTCTDPYTKETTDSQCLTCYGVGYVGGYYTPVPTIYGDISPDQDYPNRDLESGEGMVNQKITKGIFVAAPEIAMRDIIVNKTSDIRQQVHAVKTITHLRGVPLLLEAELRMIPSDNIAYYVPLGV
jgi:hypothetical protein